MSDDWESMDSAPRDGAVIEIKNSYGILPTFGLYQWEDRWMDARDPTMGIMSGIERKLTWRPFGGELDSYRDYNPSMDDWRRAASLWPHV